MFLLARFMMGSAKTDILHRLEGGEENEDYTERDSNGRYGMSHLYDEVINYICCEHMRKIVYNFANRCSIKRAYLKRKTVSNHLHGNVSGKNSTQHQTCSSKAENSRQ